MKLRRAILILLICTFAPTLTYGQGGVGLPFLKIGIGARTAGMGSVFTGVADDIYTLYWNPGGLGHIRRWQWSASYNRWFTDVYQGSFTLVNQFRSFGSKKTTIGFSVNYLGMPEWDATGGAKAAVSAGHIMAGVSLGQRLDWISEWLAIGGTVRVISSTLEDYSSTGLSYDVGLLLRPERFKLGGAGLGLFDWGIFTMGVSMLHMGPDMTFDAVATKLPRTIRAGLSYRMGRYHGLSLLLASDAVNVKGKEWAAAVASELWWRDTLGARVGYRFNGKDLGEFSLGVGLRWHGVFGDWFNMKTRHYDALEINVANMGYSDALQQTYRGSVSHYPIAPEPFRLDAPQVVRSQILGESSQITMTWEEAKDPDPFDEVGYLLIVDQSEEKVNRAVQIIERDMPGFLISPLKEEMMICEHVPETSYTTEFNEGGIYYWAVAAYDLAQHARLAGRGEEHVVEFQVATTDLLVRDIMFDHSQWITTTPEQGTLHVTIANDGVVDADTFQVVLRDHSEGEPWRILLDRTIPSLAVGSEMVLDVDWYTRINGPHHLEAVINAERKNVEINRANNILSKTHVSIPKGIVTIPDTMEVMVTGTDYTEIPIVPEVYFELNSSEVDPIFYVDGVLTPGLLQTLVDRMRMNRGIRLRIMGSIDAMDGETNTALADERAQSVKRVLIELGAPESRLEIVTIHPRKIQGQGVVRDDPDDARWVGQQYRVVGFSVDEEHEETMFQPYRIAVDTTLSDRGIPVTLDIVSPGQTNEWVVVGSPRDIQITEPEIAQGDDVKGLFYWNGMDASGALVPRDRHYEYRMVLTDTLTRTFMTHPDSVYMYEKRTLRRWEMFGSAHFNSVEPIYQFYWKRVMALGEEMLQNPSMRIRFEGHACKIGTEAVNDRLSLRRAQAFTEAFKQRMRELYPRAYQGVWARVDEPVGYGETTPLVVKTLEHGVVELGDNESPIGRHLNRRTQVLLFMEN